MLKKQPQSAPWSYLHGTREGISYSAPGSPNPAKLPKPQLKSRRQNHIFKVVALKIFGDNPPRICQMVYTSSPQTCSPGIYRASYATEYVTEILPCRSSDTGTDQVTRFLAVLPSFSTKRRT